MRITLDLNDYNDLLIVTNVLRLRAAKVTADIEAGKLAAFNERYVGDLYRIAGASEAAYDAAVSVTISEL